MAFAINLLLIDPPEFLNFFFKRLQSKFCRFSPCGSLSAPGLRYLHVPSDCKRPQRDGTSIRDKPKSNHLEVKASYWTLFLSIWITSTMVSGLLPLGVSEVNYFWAESIRPISSGTANARRTRWLPHTPLLGLNSPRHNNTASRPVWFANIHARALPASTQKTTAGRRPFVE